MTVFTPSLPSLDECIPHRNWQRALDESFALLITAQPGDVICLVGPSRAGKTRLIQRLNSLLSGNNNFEKTGELPVVSVEASNTGPNGRFSTKSFVHQMLRAVRHPLFCEDSLNAIDPRNLDRKPEHELRRALELALQHRQSRYLFIDEAQHARYATKDSLAVMDSWKCLARAGGVTLVLVGAYPMLDIIRDSPHMVGRKREIHLSRYGTTEDDIRQFGYILQYYQQELASVCSEEQPLIRHIELLYFGSLGCIGLLRSWLLYAAALAQVGQTTINEEILRQSMLSDADREVVYREISDGERLLLTSKDVQSVKSGTRASGNSQSAKVSTKRKAFERKPKRHTAGGRGREGSESPRGGAE